MSLFRAQYSASWIVQPHVYHTDYATNACVHAINTKRSSLCAYNHTHRTLIVMVYHNMAENALHFLPTFAVVLYNH